MPICTCDNPKCGEWGNCWDSRTPWTEEKQKELEDWQGASQAYRDAYYTLRDLGFPWEVHQLTDGVALRIHLDFLFKAWKNSQIRAEKLVLERIYGA